MGEISGLCLVNKPSGLTSHDVVHRARKIFKTKSVGHTGTLDPLAKGLLVLTLGKANKLSQYIMEGDKAYRTQVRLGVKTDTLDRTGKVVRESEVSCSNEDIQEAVRKLTGLLDLKVPDYSAIKVDGKKLYKLARNNQEVPIVFRPMHFFNIHLESIKIPFLEVEFHCSKGSYVRSWVESLGEELGCGAHVYELLRLKNGPYHLDSSIGLEGKEAGEILSSEAFIPFDRILPDWPRVKACHDEKMKLENGLLMDSLALKGLQALSGTDQRFVFIEDAQTRNLLSFLEVHEENNLSKLRIKKVFSGVET